MGIDYGEKRIGIASTDESGLFALPRMVVANNSELLDKVLEFAHENEIEKVIIGESKNFEGKPNSIMVKVEEFKKELENKGLKVIFHPELLTTLEAAQIQGRGEMTDASAAAIILKSYIDNQLSK